MFELTKRRTVTCSRTSTLSPNALVKDAGPASATVNPYPNRIKRSLFVMSYRIAMLSVHTSPLDFAGRTKDAGGMNIYIRELAKALAHRNINVDIFTRRTNAHTPYI